MDKITMYAADDTAYELPRTRDYTVSVEEIGTTKVMLSGKEKRDITGYRSIITVNWDWFPAETLTAILPLIRSGNFIRCTLPLPEGTADAMFSVSMPSPRIFKFVNGAPMWRDISLTFRAQEVS